MPSVEPIAIIGIGCRFPQAESPEAFWRLLRDGVDAITDVPAERWNFADFHHDDPATPGKTNSRFGGFLDRIEDFDPYFFRISPREAARMDPQQRLLLEVTWEALESGGQTLEKLAGSRVGVFVGLMNADYAHLQLNDLHGIDTHVGSGSSPGIAANRVSFAFDFQGPSLVVDTLCSSSLVAVHLACQSLRNGDAAPVALACGVNVILRPAMHIFYSKAGLTAPDGRCKSFDSRADGIVRGEGVGVVVLKLLSQALKDGDPVHAVIRGSAVNQDGRSNGLTAPSRWAQIDVLRQAYTSAGVSPGQVQYVEAHGTGTPLGDPIEAMALGTVLATDRSPDNVCAIGSVKTNFGHLESAAGIASLIKTTLMLKHRSLVPSLHYRQPNVHIPFDELPLRVQQKFEEWGTADACVRYAGVSSFGLGGTNAHVVLEESPRAPADEASSETRPAVRSGEVRSGEVRSGEDGAQGRAHLLVLSAHNAAALGASAASYRDYLSSVARDSDAPLADLCYSAAVRRNHHDHRLALVGNSAASFVEGLEDFAMGRLHAGLSSGRKSAGKAPKAAFVFSGQGAQWAGMGRQLWHRENVFRMVVEECDALFRRHAAWSVTDELLADESRSRLSETEIAQPALFTLQVALVALWRARGITPNVVVGHSAGEVAAAHVAGVLSLEDSVAVVFHRARLMQRATGLGRMAAVELSPEDAAASLAGYEQRLCVAAHNAPNSSVLSGDADALAEVVEGLQQQGVYCRPLPVNYAFHSPQMDAFGAELREALRDIEPRPATLPIVATGARSEKFRRRNIFDADYWATQIRHPVLFCEAIEELIKQEHRFFIEIAPHPVLSASVLQTLHARGREGVARASLRRGEDEGAVMLASLGALYTHGWAVNWKTLYGAGAKFVALPSYPFQRERFRHDTPTHETSGSDVKPESDVRRERSPRDSIRHPLLGSHFASAQPSGEHFWEIEIDRDTPSYLKDHQIQGAVVLPGATYIEMALAAANEAFARPCQLLKDIEFHKALFLPEHGARLVQISLKPADAHEASFRIYSRKANAPPTEAAWTLHAVGTLCYEPDDDTPMPSPQNASPDVFAASAASVIEGGDYYRRLKKYGLDYHELFQGVERLYLKDGAALGRVEMPAGLRGEAGRYRLHPAMLDACLQVGWSHLAPHRADEENSDGRAASAFMPVGIARLQIYESPQTSIWSRADLSDAANQQADGLEVNVRMMNADGRVLVEISGIQAQRIDAGAQHRAGGKIDGLLYEIEWRQKDYGEERKECEAAPPESPATQNGWLIFADGGGVGEAFARLARARGERCLLLYAGDAQPSSQQEETETICVAASCEAEMRRILGEIFETRGDSLRGVLHLWGLDAPFADDTQVAVLEQSQLVGCGSLVSLVHSLDASLAPSQTPPLWVATRGAQKVGEANRRISVFQATLWGMGRALLGEHSEFMRGLIDLDAETDIENCAAQLLAEMSARVDETQVAFRDGRRYVARLRRLVQMNAPETRAPRWRADASYLVTGGLGGLGFKVARWMVEQGARRLILMGRTPLPARALWKEAAGEGTRVARQIAEILQLEAMGATVHLAAVDVANEAELSAFLDRFRLEGWSPLRGVVHAAGTIEERLLSDFDAESLLRVLRPKVTGGWLLHRLLKDDALDFFVLFSSASSILSSPRLGAYAAANAFLDALAQQRKLEGDAALSINWGAWSEVGMAVEAGRTSADGHRAMESITSAQGTEILGRLLRLDVPQVGVMAIDWARWRKYYPSVGKTPLLVELMSDGSPPQEERRYDEGAGALRERLVCAPPTQRREMLEAYLREEVARVLNFAPAQLDTQMPLNSLGLDSLMAAELKNRLEAGTGIPVPIVFLLQDNSVAGLSVLLLPQLETAAASRTPDREAETYIPAVKADEGISMETAQRLLENFDLLSDADVNALLSKMTVEEDTAE